MKIKYLNVQFLLWKRVSGSHIFYIYLFITVKIRALTNAFNITNVFENRFLIEFHYYNIIIIGDIGIDRSRLYTRYFVSPAIRSLTNTISKHTSTVQCI